MPVITINSAIGCGAVEVGTLVARTLEIDYVDRLVLAESAKRIGATVEAVADKEQRVNRTRDRVARLLQRMIERSALSMTGAEPYFGTGYDVLVGQDYTELEREPITTAQQIDDRHFMEVTRNVIEDLARAGNVVINGRGSNLILQDWPGVVHVGLFAHMDFRVRTLVDRLHISEAEARRIATRMERARRVYFHKFFKADPYHPSYYHIMLNMDKLRVEQASGQIVLLAKGL